MPGSPSDPLVSHAGMDRAIDPLLGWNYVVTVFAAAGVRPRAQPAMGVVRHGQFRTLGLCGARRLYVRAGRAGRGGLPYRDARRYARVRWRLRRNSPDFTAPVRGILGHSHAGLWRGGSSRHSERAVADQRIARAAGHPASLCGLVAREALRGVVFGLLPFRGDDPLRLFGNSVAVAVWTRGTRGAGG